MSIVKEMSNIEVEPPNLGPVALSLLPIIIIGTIFESNLWIVAITCGVVGTVVNELIIYFKNKKKKGISIEPTQVISKKKERHLRLVQK